jgi:hypothetical protein
MDRNGHPWRELPGYEMIDERNPFTTGDGHVLPHFEGVLVSGPAWARRLRSLAPLASVGRILVKVLAIAGGVACAGGLILVLIGREKLIGLAESPGGYRPIHLVVIVLAFLLIVLISGEAAWVGLQNRAATGQERARRVLVREARGREEDFRRQVAARMYVDGAYLPDPDLTYEPGFVNGQSYEPGVRTIS